MFDPAKIQDHATYAEPHQYSTGVSHVIVNGVLALENGEPTDGAARAASCAAAPGPAGRTAAAAPTAADWDWPKVG